MSEEGLVHKIEGGGMTVYTGDGGLQEFKEALDNHAESITKDLTKEEEQPKTLNIDEMTPDQLESLSRVLLSNMDRRARRKFIGQKYNFSTYVKEITKKKAK